MPPEAPLGDGPLTVGFLLVPTFSMMAFVSAVEPLRVANRLGERTLFAWEIVTPDGRPAQASNEMSLVAARAVADAPTYPLAIVCAGFEPLRHASPAIDRWLRRHDRAGVPLGAMDTGAFLLAGAHLLDGHRATVHWESLESFREQFPSVETEGGLFVIDGNRFTCAGGTAALDMMLHLIARWHGHRLATAVSEQFIHARIRHPEDAQRMAARDRQGIAHHGLARALELMEQRIEEPIAPAAIAEAAGMSLRHLERMFESQFQCSPREYYLHLRLQKARSLLQYTALPVVEVGLACGFASPAHFSRSYRRWARKSPSEERAMRQRGALPALR